jgi:hypothetical protein
MIASSERIVRNPDTIRPAYGPLPNRALTSIVAGGHRFESVDRWR